MLRASFSVVSFQLLAAFCWKRALSSILGVFRTFFCAARISRKTNLNSFWIHVSTAPFCRTTSKVPWGGCLPGSNPIKRDVGNKRGAILVFQIGNGPCLEYLLPRIMYILLVNNNNNNNSKFLNFPTQCSSFPKVDDDNDFLKMRRVRC